MEQWAPWAEFVQSQFDALTQTEENIARWKISHEEALQNNNSEEARRLERLIEISTADMYRQSIELKNLVKGRNAHGK